MKIVVVIQITVIVNVEPVENTIVVVINVFPIVDSVSVPVVVACVRLSHKYAVFMGVNWIRVSQAGTIPQLNLIVG